MSRKTEHPGEGEECDLCMSFRWCLSSGDDAGTSQGSQRSGSGGRCCSGDPFSLFFLLSFTLSVSVFVVFCCSFSQPLSRFCLLFSSLCRPPEALESFLASVPTALLLLFCFYFLLADYLLCLSHSLYLAFFLSASTPVSSAFLWITERTATWPSCIAVHFSCSHDSGGIVQHCHHCLLQPAHGRRRCCSGLKGKKKGKMGWRRSGPREESGPGKK